MTEENEGGSSVGRPDGAAKGRRLPWAIVGAAGGVALLALAFFGLRMSGVLKPPVPTPACVEPKLALGSSVYHIKPVKAAADGSVAVPQDAPDAAYWVEGTNAHYVFGLSAAPANLALQNSLSAGVPVTITWADCMTDTYAIESVQPGPVDPAKLVDQSTGGVTAFVQGSGASAGLVVQAIRPVPVETPQPVDENALQVDLSFKSTSASADGKSVVMDVEVKNAGKKPFTVAAKDVSLTGQDGKVLEPSSVQPALPVEVAAGASQEFQITFPKPAGNTGVFKYLDTTVDVYF